MSDIMFKMFCVGRTSKFRDREVSEGYIAILCCTTVRFVDFGDSRTQTYPQLRQLFFHLALNMSPMREVED